MEVVVRKKHREGHDRCQDVEDTDGSTEECDTVRSEVFNFHGV